MKHFAHLHINNSAHDTLSLLYDITYPLSQISLSQQRCFFLQLFISGQSHNFG
jgi:hypothetical protein